PFPLGFGGRTTPPIAWSSNTTTLKNNIQAALGALATVGSGNISVTASANPAIKFFNPLSGTLFLNGTAILGGTAAIQGGGSGGIAGAAKPAVGSVANPLFFEVPRAIVDPHTNIFTPGVLDVPIIVSNAPAASTITSLKVR